MTRREQRWSPSAPDMVTLDNGHCCGRKPMIYKRPELRLFCPRCDRQFDALGNQVQNFAWRPDAARPGKFERTR